MSMAGTVGRHIYDQTLRIDLTFSTRVVVPRHLTNHVYVVDAPRRIPLTTDTALGRHLSDSEDSGGTTSAAYQSESGSDTSDDDVRRREHSRRRAERRRRLSSSSSSGHMTRVRLRPHLIEDDVLPRLDLDARTPAADLNQIRMIIEYLYNKELVSPLCPTSALPRIRHILHHHQPTESTRHLIFSDVGSISIHLYNMIALTMKRSNMIRMLTEVARQSDDDRSDDDDDDYMSDDDDDGSASSSSAALRHADSHFQVKLLCSFLDASQQQQSPSDAVESAFLGRMDRKRRRRAHKGSDRPSKSRKSRRPSKRKRRSRR